MSFFKHMVKTNFSLNLKFQNVFPANYLPGSRSDNLLLYSFPLYSRWSGDQTAESGISRSE
jgi:hypothetical protein